MIKSVILRYPIEKAYKTKKIKLSSDMIVSFLRSSINQQIPQFRDLEYFLILEDDYNTPQIINESLTLNSLSDQPTLKVLLNFKYCDINVIMPEDNLQIIQFDMSRNVQDNIEAIISEKPEKYTFLYYSNSDMSYPRITTNLLPLIFQGWAGESLILLQKVDIYDVRDNHKNKDILLNDLEKTRKYFYYCKKAAIHRLSLFDSRKFADLISLDCLSSKNPDISRSVKEYLKYDPSKINDLSFKTIVVEEYQHYKNLNLSNEKLISEYVYLCADNYKLSFCYIDHVKLVLLNKRWRMPSNRFLYISQRVIATSKDFLLNFVNNEPFSTIRNSYYDNDLVIITFQNDEKWGIKTERPQALVQIINEIMINSLPNSSSKEIKIEGIQKQFKENKTQEKSKGISYYNSAIFDSRSIIKEQKDENIIIMYGISKLICPTEKESLKQYSSEDVPCRELEILRHLNVQNHLFLPKREPVPNIQWIPNIFSFLSFSNPTTRYTVYCLLIVIFIIIFTK